MSTADDIKRLADEYLEAALVAGVGRSGSTRRALHTAIDALQSERDALLEALRPFASFVFGPGWMGHEVMRSNGTGDPCVLYGWGADSQPTGVNVMHSDFENARAAVASIKASEGKAA
jgi:hypothetical protein